MTVSSDIRREIVKRLEQVEIEHSVRVLYACESGSRAWNFASPDSDYDVRFLYVRRMDWYLSFDVESRRDVIEYPIVDAMTVADGISVRPSTSSLGRMAPFSSGYVVQRGSFAQDLRELAPTAMNARALCYHYSHMARGNAREYLFNEKVRLKKYFYVLRPLFAIRYIEQNRGIPPVPFEDLVEAVAPHYLREAIARLLALKRSTGELGLGEPVPEIDDFIESELQRHGDMFSGQDRPDVNESGAVRIRLNEIFRGTLVEGGGRQ